MFKKYRKKRIFFFLTCLLLISGCSKKDDKKEEVKKDPEPVVKNTSFSFIAAGDALLHRGVYDDANTYKKDDKGYYIYDFNKMFINVKDIVKSYDLKFYNQETIIGGKNLGMSSYPCFNSPDEIGDNLTNDVGFNIVNLATNHTMDKGTAGAIYSANYWDKKKDKVLAVGSYKSQEARDNIEIREENGIKYAVLSYTYGTNGISVPSGYEYLVNIWPTDTEAKYENYKTQVKKDVDSVRDKVDVLMVSMHWGVEYVHIPTSYQKDAAEYLSSLGVDVIIGTHPHVVQPVEYVNNTLVIYSLGNMISAQNGTDKRIGAMAAFTVNKTTVDGKTTKVEITDPKVDLIYTQYTNYKNFSVVPFNKMTDAILPNYKSIYEQYKKYLNPKEDEKVKVGFFE